MAGYPASNEKTLNLLSNTVLYGTELFQKVVLDKLDLYKRCEKHIIQLHTGNTVSVSNDTGSCVNTVAVMELANWHILPKPEDGNFEDAVRDTVVELASEVAHVVEYLIRQESHAHYGTNRDVSNVVVADIFGDTNNRNLEFSVVTDAPLSVQDPAGLIPGWISYRLHFFVARRPANVKVNAGKP